MCGIFALCNYTDLYPNLSEALIEDSFNNLCAGPTSLELWRRVGWTTKIALLAGRSQNLDPITIKLHAFH